MPNQVIKTSPCGNVTVYERDNTKKLYARVKIGKQWKPFATKKADPEEAYTVAMERFTEEQVLRKHGKEYSKSTLLKHNIALKKVFTKAAKDKSVQFSTHQIPSLSTKGKGLKPKKRPPFEGDEIVKLLVNKDEDWITEPPKKLSRYKRSILFFYMNFIYKTGVRPGEETVQLRYGDFMATKNVAGDDVILVNLERSKIDTEEGRVIYINGHHYMDTLVKLNEMKRVFMPEYKAKEGDLVFSDMQGEPLTDMEVVFREYLIHKKLRKNPRYKNRNRTLYSLRHTYATEQCRKGQTLENLAKAMGTSVQMLNEYYIHFGLDEIFTEMFQQEREHHNEAMKEFAKNVTSGKRHREKQREKQAKINKVYE
jgi:integrase